MTTKIPTNFSFSFFFIIVFIVDLFFYHWNNSYYFDTCFHGSLYDRWYGSIIFSITEHTADHKNNFKYLAATEDGIYVLTRSRSTAAVSLDTAHTWYAIEEEKYVPWSGVESWSCNGNGTCITIAVNDHLPGKKAFHSLPFDIWIYDTKEGNAVSIIDQFIEYSSVKQLAEAAEAETTESTESTESAAAAHS